MWRIIVLSTIISLTAAAKSTYENYKVFNIIPVSTTQIDYLKGMEQFGFSFWKKPTIVMKPVKLMVPPHKLPEFYRIMNKTHFSHKLFINNVQELINRTTQSIDSENDTCNSNMFPFNKYPTLNEIYDYIHNLSLTYNDTVKIVKIGKTFNQKEILGVEVSFNKCHLINKNPGIFLEGGIHGNEWISPATVIYILHQLMTSTDPDVRALAESHNWYIVPLVNPDGYEYTHTTDRLWTKSRSESKNINNIYCIGVNLNRNWDFVWGYGDTDLHDKCSNEYAGSTSFSELETRALERYIANVSDKFNTYISFHGSSQLLLFPYGYTDSHRGNYYDLYAIGLIAIEALKQRYGTEYNIGNVAETVYVAGGISIDYIKSTLQKTYVFSYDLRARDYGFLQPPDQIIPTGQETLDSIVSMFKEIKRRGYTTHE